MEGGRSGGREVRREGGQEGGRSGGMEVRREGPESQEDDVCHRPDIVKHGNQRQGRN